MNVFGKAGQDRSSISRRRRRKVFGLLASLALAVGMAAVAEVPASAAPTVYKTATVKAASTQKMQGPHLSYFRNNGVWAKNQKVDLLCYQRGQAVSGYFGKSDLWYKTSLNNPYNAYVADVDIETGSNSPVAPECSWKAASARASSISIRVTPNVSAQREGSIQLNNRVFVTCYVIGQTVSGWGGTSSIWYRYSDGSGYIADVDLWTGSNGVVVKRC